MRIHKQASFFRKDLPVIMSHCLSKNLNEIEEIQLIKENVQGFGIPGYSISVKRGEGKAPYWSYKRESNLTPEAVITMLLEEHNFLVMSGEGKLIRQFFNLLQLIAHEEHHNGSMVKKTAKGVRISLRPCGAISPNSPFTIEYIRKLLTTSSINEIIEYLEIYGQLVLYKRPYGFEEEELAIIYVFLKAFTVERLLAMFELAYSAYSQGLTGWPDITAIKDDCVYFIEVKTKDSLTKRQKDWLTLYKDSLDIDYRIISLKQH